jgi:hypothetical protein
VQFKQVPLLLITYPSLIPRPFTYVSFHHFIFLPFSTFFSLAMYSSSVPSQFYSSFTHSFLSLPSSSFTDKNIYNFLLLPFHFCPFIFHMFLIFFLFYVFLNLKYHFFILWLLFFLFIFRYSHLLLNPFCYILSFLCSPLFNFMLAFHLHAIYPLVSNIT